MRKRKLMVLVLALILALGSASTALAAYYRDTTNHWAEEHINWATENGYLKGDGNGYFRPEDTVTKAEYVTGINRLINSTSKSTIRFTDVKSGDWFYDEMAKGVYNGIIDNTNSNFGPNQAINRDEAARIIARAYKLANFADGATIFRDYNNITFKGEVGALVAKKVLNGWPDGNYYPNKNLTRAEFAKILRTAVGILGLPSKPVATTPVVDTSGTDWWYWYGYPYDYGYGYYYGCDVELSNLLAAITSGESYLPLTQTYTAESLDILRKAVEEGRVTYDTYKGYVGKYEYNYGYNYGYYGYSIRPWNYSTFSAFETAMRNEYPGVFTTSELRNIYNNYRDYRYDYNYGYYGYEINPRNYSSLSAFETAMRNAYGNAFTSAQIRDIYNGRYGYYYDNYRYPYYYDSCPYQGTIDAATKKINDAIKGLVKKDANFVSVTGVTVSPKTGTIKVGETIQLTATVSPANATDKRVIWKSSNEAIATVDSNGLVTGIADSTTPVTITATTVDCSFSDTAKITVIPADDPPVDPEETYKLTVIVSDEGGHPFTDAIVVVKDSTGTTMTDLNALPNGTYTITANRTGYNEGTATVTINDSDEEVTIKLSQIDETPSTYVLTVKVFTKPQGEEIDITNSVTIEVIDEATNLTVDRNALPNGTYTVKVTHPDHHTATVNGVVINDSNREIKIYMTFVITGTDPVIQQQGLVVENPGVKVEEVVLPETPVETPIVEPEVKVDEEVVPEVPEQPVEEPIETPPEPVEEPIEIVEPEVPAEPEAPETAPEVEVEEP